MLEKLTDGLLYYFSKGLQELYNWKINFLIIIVIALLELLFPARRFTLNENIKRIFFGSFYLIFNIVLIYPAAAIISEFTLSYLRLNHSMYLHKIIFIDFSKSSYVVLAYIATTILYWISWDFVQYWVHRLLHTKYFYPIHEHHHSIELDAFGSFRHSPIELIFLLFAITIPIDIYFSVIFSPDASPGFIPYLVTFMILIEHSNIRFGWPISGLIITPQMHRIHHSQSSLHWGYNFSQYFTLWDYIFKTLYVPSKNEYPITGEPPSKNNMFKKYILF